MSLNPAVKSIVMLVLTVAIATVWAQGQTVYRCGPDGRQFSDQPCQGGQLMDVAQAPRPEADLADARARATRERQQAAAIDARQARLAALEQPAGMRGSRLRSEAQDPWTVRSTRRPDVTEGRLSRSGPAQDGSVRQARSPHRLAAAGTSP